jgi:pheganomycin biosynthesis PGM1-like protein
MVKHNEGVSGAGNAVVYLEGLPPPGEAAERAALVERVKGMKFESARQRYDSYMAKLEELAGIVEERVIGEEIRSPSVQLRITPLGQLEVLSTHDQVLGGPSGQSYLGCRFPADPAYASLITRDAVKVGQELVGEGVLGRFAFDFVAARNGGAWTSYAIELNLRKGGTTHPFLTLQFLTDGLYDPETATFTPPSGRPKCFVATDHLESELYRGLLPQDVFDIMVRHELHFNQTRQTGIVLHMLTALSERGRLGLTAVGESQAEADQIYQRAVEVLDREAEAAMRQDPLPAL